MKRRHLRGACVAGGAALIALSASTAANAGAFGVREQSAYFQGSSFAGSAAGGDISSMFWNSAAVTTLQGFNTSTNATVVIGSADIDPTGGVFVTGAPGAPGRGFDSTDVGTAGLVPASYATYQLSERLYAGLAINAPFGFITKPDNKNYAGAPLGTSSKVFSVDVNPTIGYKIAPNLSIGVGAQIEYFKIRLNRANFSSALPGVDVSPARSFDADDWGVGATAGVIWTPTSRTSIGLGYRSAVGVDVSGDFRRGATGGNPLSIVNTTATGKLTLPDEVTLSIRQGLTDRLTLLGTIEWQNWSRVGNVKAISESTGALLETLNLNYRDGWFYSVGLEYAYSPFLTLRTGIGFEKSPIEDKTRNVLLPDTDRVHLSVGASYKYSDRITLDIGYTHLFMDEGSICVASPATGSTNCNSGTPGAAKVFLGNADPSVDIVSLGLKYKVSGPREELEPYK